MRVLACDLGAFDDAERARYKAVRAELGARRLGAREVADGYEFSYCCPFFDFALEIPAGATEIRLTIGGGVDVKAFLQSAMA